MQANEQRNYTRVVALVNNGGVVHYRTLLSPADRQAVYVARDFRLRFRRVWAPDAETGWVESNVPTHTNVRFERRET